MFEYLNINAVEAPVLKHEPFRHLTTSGVINPDKIPGLLESFPAISDNQPRLVREIEYTGDFKRLVEELESPEFSNIISEKIGVDFTGYSPYVEARSSSSWGAGHIHNDAPGKIVTMIIYMNETWDHYPEGCLRLLYSKSENELDHYAAEVVPLVGNAVLFKREDHGWHGFHRYAGPRKTVLISWQETGKSHSSVIY